MIAARFRLVEAISVAARMQADALTATAIHLAVFDLLAGLADGKVKPGRFALNGVKAFCTLGQQSRIAIAVADEGGKVDLNTASPQLVQALFAAVYRDRQVADEMSMRLLKRRQVSDTDRSAGPQDRDSSPVRTILELDQMLGNRSETWRHLLPFVTVHSRSPGIDPEVASPELLRALSGQQNGISSQPLSRSAIPDAFVTPSSRQFFAVAAEAATGSGGHSAQEAVVEISSLSTNGHRIREWREGTQHSDDQAMIAGSLPPC
ncbi:MAG: general secretion pathway protein GspK [Hyphomicrobiales bacterium]|nr:general secretion pathway protein GspK [Hyphomicrobiales bacterium]